MPLTAVAWAPTADHHALAEAVADALGGGEPSTQWARLHAIGVLGLLAPDAVGGGGGDELALVAALEAARAARPPLPVVETAAAVVPALAGAVDPRLAPLLTAGWTATVGTPGHLPFAGSCELVLVDRGGDEVAVLQRPVPVVAKRFQAANREVCRLDPAANLTTAPTVAVDGRWRARWRLGAAAMLNGISGRLVETTQQHLATRHLFGRRLGDFQAARHLLAEAAAELELARPTAWHAAWALATEHADAVDAVRVAVAAAGRAHAVASKVALQLHGAIGYTAEHPVSIPLRLGAMLQHGAGLPTLVESQEVHHRHL